eukprot:11131363-Heterocapsa_arctica.AAC.1
MSHRQAHGSSLNTSIAHGAALLRTTLPHHTGLGFHFAYNILCNRNPVLEILARQSVRTS